MPTNHNATGSTLDYLKDPIDVYYQPLNLFANITIKHQYKDICVADHPFLAEGGAMYALFLQLRKSLLAMHLGVVEEILKLYIIFNAETNFIDVVPQKSRLVLMINIPFYELNDPRSIARNISWIGRWGK